MNLSAVERKIIYAVRTGDYETLHHLLGSIKHSRKLLDRALDINHNNEKKLLRGMNIVYHYIIDGIESNHEFEIWDADLDDKFFENVFSSRNIYAHIFPTNKEFRTFLALTAKLTDIDIDDKYLDILINESLLDDSISDAPKLPTYDLTHLRHYLLLRNNIPYNVKLSIAGAFSNKDIKMLERNVQDIIESNLKIRLDSPNQIYIINLGEIANSNKNNKRLKIAKTTVDLLNSLKEYRKILNELDLGQEPKLEELGAYYLQEKYKKYGESNSRETDYEPVKVLPSIDNNQRIEPQPEVYPQYINIEHQKNSNSISLMDIPNRAKEFVFKHLKKQNTIEK